MKKFKKILSAMAALAVLTVGTASYASAANLVNYDTWETTYTYVPNGPSNTGYTDKCYMTYSIKGQQIYESYYNNSLSNSAGVAYVKVSDTTVTLETTEIPYQKYITCVPKLKAGYYNAPDGVNYIFSSYTKYSGNRFTAKGAIQTLY